MALGCTPEADTFFGTALLVMTRFSLIAVTIQFMAMPEMTGCAVVMAVTSFKAVKAEMLLKTRLA